MDFPKTANNKRKSKWPDGKIEKAAYEMWKKSMGNFLSSVNEGISDMDFSDTLG